MSTESAMVTFSAVSDMKKVGELLGLLPAQMKSALRTASRQAGQWANREGSRGLAKAVGVPMKILREGMRVKFRYRSTKGYGSANVWFGLNGISLEHLRAKQQKSGVKAAGTKYAGGFIVTKVGVANSKRRGMIGKAFARKGDARTPVSKLKYQINERGMAFIQTFSDQVGQKFVDLFFSQIDKIQGRDAGDSLAIVGSSNIARR